ncbi:hypothetical protein B0H17DRAFT_1043912 [Mycena rosella]|uniref:Secreted protein n=1 Tax=Mycena rosella TaxID=1033263 RepID=A0AAD7DXX9_MYCRO|nr:hypothetical protein B0H17DRAFT_1043912 [Mycena rosella]
MVERYKAVQVELLVLVLCVVGVGVDVAVVESDVATRERCRRRGCLATRTPRTGPHLVANARRRRPAGVKPDNHLRRNCRTLCDMCSAIRVRTKGALVGNCEGLPTPVAESSRDALEVVAREAGRYLLNHWTWEWRLGCGA